MAKTPVKPDQSPFTCPRCGHKHKKFHSLCPECGRPFFRDYPDTQVHPRDPDPTGIYKGKFWARVFWCARCWDGPSICSPHLESFRIGRYS